jgi:hypothetical protein
MPPGYLAQPTFLGQPTGAGVNPILAGVLAAVEQDLQNQYNAANPVDANGNAISFTDWCGLTEAAIGWRTPPAGFHGSGSAVDVNFSLNPYIATRTGATVGGEQPGTGTYTGTSVAGPQTIVRTDAWSNAVAVYDRAVAFAFNEGDTADVTIRVHDTIDVTYDRFRKVSDSLAYYFSWAVSGTATIQRAPFLDVDTWPDQSPNFGGIPATEQIGEATATQALDSLFQDAGFQAAHPSWAATSIELYYQMLRDYEKVRVPMLIGSPTQPIALTRNPANGFLHLRRELVLSLITTGNGVLSASGAAPADGSPLTMRWGASDFGAASSGDVQHFDLGGHPAQYPPQP